MLDRLDEPLDVAFARNLRWLLKFGRVLRRWQVQNAVCDSGFRFRDVMAEIDRWLEAGDLVMDKAGDFRLTKAGMAKIASIASS